MGTSIETTKTLLQDIQSATADIFVETEKHNTLVGGMVSTAQLKVAAPAEAGISEYKVQSNI